MNEPLRGFSRERLIHVTAMIDRATVEWRLQVERK